MTFEAPKFEDCVEGSEPEARAFGPVSRTNIVRYQGASGDFQPIHHDEPFCRESGYEAPLVVGMYPAGALSAWATDWLGPRNLRRVRLRWKSQLWPGDELSLHGRIVGRDEAERRVDLELAGTKPDGSVALQAWMSFVL